VRSKIARIFNGAALIDEGRTPYFTVGDFNGDLSQDLVVAVKPAPGRLSEINDQLSNWILVDPRPPAIPGQVARREQIYVGERDSLLAVIHGYGPEGWRHREATQTYLVKNAADGPMISRPHNEAVPANKEKLPRISGDVIAQTVSGQPGFLYFNGARYAWFDPAHPQLILHPRRVHQSREER